MKLSIAILLFLMVSYHSNGDCQKDIITNHLIPENGKYFKKCFLFNDSNYIFTLTTIDTSASYDVDKPTTVVNFYHVHTNTIDTLLSDSLFCRNSKLEDPELHIDFEDYNFDGIEDIILPAGSDPRNNHGYHLYIVNNNAKSLNYINGFNEIGNPEADTLNQLIESCVLSGQNFCKFYEINQNNKLIDLGHEFNLSVNKSYSAKHRRAIQEIISERRKK